jgi:LysM repeat protein
MRRLNNHRKFICLLLGLAGVILIASLAEVEYRRVLAAPLAQSAIFTPTPGPDGRIIYIVKPNDTLLSISLTTGVPVDQLRALNNISGDTIIEGQELLLGLAGPAEVTFTPGPSPTPTPILPTPTPRPGSANLCVLLFNDRNGDSLRQEDEPVIPDGAISASNRSGSVSLTAQTEAGTEPICFEEIPEGDFNVTVAIPEGYNPTTVSNFAVQLRAGDEVYLDFGAQPNSEMLADAPIESGGQGRSPLLGILGTVIILAGLGLAIFARQLLKGR